jgi:hypothetical protein
MPGRTARRAIGIAVASVVVLASIAWIASRRDAGEVGAPSLPQDDDARPPPSPLDSSRGRAAPEAPPSDLLSVDGVVVDESGDPVRDATIELVARGDAPLDVARSDASGQFRAELRGVGADTILVARDAGRRSLPSADDLRRASHGVLLILRRAVGLRVRAVTSERVPAPGAVVHVVEIPDSIQVPIPTLEAESLRLLVRSLRAGDDGVVETTVRPGTTGVRMIGPDGTRGPLVRVVATTGRLDLGDLVVPSDGPEVSARIVDEAGWPVAGAWLQLSVGDLSLRHGISASEGELPTFVADRAGRVRLGRLSASSLPLVVAAGSPRHRIASATLGAGETTVRLTGRFEFDVTIVSADPLPAEFVAAASKEPGLRASARDLSAEQRRLSPGQSKPGDPPPPPLEPSDALRLNQIVEAELVSSEPWRYRVHADEPGRFTLTFLADTSQVSLDVTVERAGQSVAFVLPHGAPRYVRCQVPERLTDARLGGAVLRVEWERPRATPAGGSLSLSSALAGTWWWAPADATRLRVLPTHPLTCPVRASVADLAAAGPDVDVPLELDPAAQLVTFTLGDRRSGSLPLTAWPILVVVDGSPSDQVVAYLTGGKAYVPLLPARYRAIPLRRLGTRDTPEDSWVSFEVRPGTTNTVSLSLATR